jgi:hypothetical protein
VQRFFGAIAILGGWLSMPAGAGAGLVFSQFFGVGHIEGIGSPVDVYGISGIIVFWVFASAAVVTALPLLVAMIAPDPRRELRVMAEVMAVVGAVLLGSELGRAFGLPLLAGAACLWVAGNLLHEDYLAMVAASDSEPEAGLVTASIETEVQDASPAPGAQPGSQPGAQPGSQPGSQPGAAVSEASGLLPPSISAAASGGLAPAATAGGSRRGRRKHSASAEQVCQWCSTAVPARQAACPNCGATLDGSAADDVAIPGLTEVPAGLRRYAENVRAGKKLPSLLKIMFSDSPIPTAIGAPPPSDADALRPPTAAVRAEMARLDEAIAAGRMPDPFDGSEPASPPDSAPPESAPEPAGNEQRS